MSTSSSSANPVVASLPIGAVFIARWAGSSDWAGVWQRVSENQIECLLPSDNTAGKYAVGIATSWSSKIVIEPLIDDEGARVIALIALGRGDLI